MLNLGICVHLIEVGNSLIPLTTMQDDGYFENERDGMEITRMKLVEEEGDRLS
jgi:hypothetical protein